MRERFTFLSVAVRDFGKCPKWTKRLYPQRLLAVKECIKRASSKNKLLSKSVLTFVEKFVVKILLKLLNHSPSFS